MREAYKESISNIDEMIFAREMILKTIRESFNHNSKTNYISFMPGKKAREYGLKIFHECEKLKAIRSEMYWILKSELF